MTYYLKFDTLGVQENIYTQEEYIALSIEEKSNCFEEPSNFIKDVNVCKLIEGEVIILPVLETQEILKFTNIDILKNAKLDTINFNYDIALKSGFIYNGVVFKIKTSTISDLLSKVEISEINNDFNFCGINHNSKANLNLLLKAMRLFTNEKYSIKKSLEKQVKDGISITSINKIILDI